MEYYCFAHTLQLVVKDGLKKMGQLKKVIAKASGVVSYVRRSSLASDLLENEGKLQSATATRWNSEVRMIRSALKVPQETLNRLDCTNLTILDRALLQDLCAILQSFEEATDVAQRQNTVTSSCVIPTVLGLKSALNGMQSRQADFNVKRVDRSTVEFF